MKLDIRKFTISAIFVAVAFVLSLIKIIDLPFGGSITLFSMLAISLPAYFFGVRLGFVASFAYSMLQLIIDPYIIHPIQLLLDYTVAFSCFGVVGFFRGEEKGLYKGFVLACIIRFLSSTVSGYIFFKDYTPENWSPIIYTVVYNGSYIFTECILSIIVISIKQVRVFITYYKRKWDIQ